MLSNFFSNQAIDVLRSEPDTLAVLDFNESAPDGAIAVRLKALGSNHPDNSESAQIVEVWKTPSQTVEHGKANGCRWSRSRDFQFLSMTVNSVSSSDIEEVAEQVYRSLLQTIQDSRYPQFLRFWNVLPNINHGSGDRENYKRFCSGRLAAFQQFGVDRAQFPAASAVGHYFEGMTIYALSSNQEPTNLANPRQVDAFSYPRQYGPSSPSFARATTVSDLCFISGTASILGHNTVHKGDLLAQLHTTNDNILYLLKEAGRKRSEVRSLRVYLRRAEDYLQVKEVVASWYPKAHIIFCHADICRADLLIEIECFCIAG